MNTKQYPTKIFAEAAKCWKLEELYAAISQLKQQVEKKQLTSLEQAILRGILASNTIEQIAKLLPGESYGLIINSTWRLYRYICTLTGTKSQDGKNYQNIPYLLETAGYKRATTIAPLPASTEQLVQGGKQSVTAISSSSHLTARQQQVDIPSSRDNKLPEKSYESSSNIVDIKQVTPNSEPLTTNSKPNIHSNNLSVVEADNFMPPISLWTKLGGMFMAGSIGVAIALSAVTPYKVIVRAQAKVRPAGELRIVEAATEGTVVEIAAKENQKVNQGDIIATIDNSRLVTQKSQLESNIQQATLQLQQIKAQITAQQNRLEAETKSINRAVASAQVQLARSRRELQDRNHRANAEVAEADANLNSTQEELNQAQTELISLQADLKSAQASLNAAKSKRDRYKIIAQSGALSQNQLEEAILDVEQQEQQVITQKVTIQRQNQEIARRKQSVAAATARLNNTQIALNPSDAEVAIAQENIEQEKATGQATLSRLKQEQEALIQQQIEIQQQQTRHRQELQQLEKELNKTAIKATVDGTLFQLNLRNPGQTVTVGQQIAQIVPWDNSLVIQALIPAQEIDQVELNQPVQMKVSACPYPDYGTLKGKVNDLAPDSITSQGNSNIPHSATTSSLNLAAGFYRVTIEPESLALGKGKNRCEIQLGMEGRAEIIAQEETVLQFLLRKSRLVMDL